MPVFGQCSEPSCSENNVRLFDCVHHCMKLVCLQHLIEHDQLIEHNQQYLNNLRTELKELWTIYSSLIDETKLQYEFEYKLKKHQQLIEDITNLFENDSINIEQHRIMLEKFKQNIEQEKQLNHYSTESFLHIEQIKTEPSGENLSIDKLDPMDVDLATRIERLNNNIKQQKRNSIIDNSSTINEYDHQTISSYENHDNETIKNQTNNKSLSIRKLSGECPFWFNGAFGLTEEFHGIYICQHKEFRQELYRHFIKFHKFTIETVEKISQAIQNKEDPFKKILFQSNDIIIDKINHFHCPFSIYNNLSLIKKNSSEHYCQTIKPFLRYSLRYHLIHIHQMTMSNANKLVQKLKINVKN